MQMYPSLINHLLKSLLCFLSALFLTTCVTNRNTARVVSLHEEYDIVMETLNFNH